MNKINFLSIISLLFILYSCQNKEGINNAKKSIDDNKLGNKNLLSFSITNEDKIFSIYKIKKGDKKGNHQLILPFESDEVKNSIDVLSTSYSYTNNTVISYNTNTAFFNPNIEITINPTLYTNNNLDIENIDKGLYLIKNGIERKFIYYDFAKNKFQNNFKNIEFDTISWVSVQLPIGAKVYENPNTKNYAVAKLQNGNVKYYNLDENNKDKKIIINYRVEPSETQNYFFEIIFKVLATLIIPFIELIFVSPNKLFSTRKKKIILWSLTIIQLILIFTLVYLSFSLEITKEKISDYILLFVSVSLTILMHFSKKKENNNNEEE